MLVPTKDMRTGMVRATSASAMGSPRSSMRAAAKYGRCRTHSPRQRHTRIGSFKSRKEAGPVGVAHHVMECHLNQETRVLPACT